MCQRASCRSRDAAQRLKQLQGDDAWYGRRTGGAEMFGKHRHTPSTDVDNLRRPLRTLCELNTCRHLHRCRAVAPCASAVGRGESECLVLTRRPFIHMRIQWLCRLLAGFGPLHEIADTMLDIPKWFCGSVYFNPCTSQSIILLP